MKRLEELVHRTDSYYVMTNFNFYIIYHLVVTLLRIVFSIKNYEYQSNEYCNDAPLDNRERKNLEALIIAIKRPLLDEQVDTNLLCLFRFGIT